LAPAVPLSRVGGDLAFCVDISDFMSTRNRKIRAGLIGGLIGGLSGGVTAFAACQRTSDFKWLIPFSAAFLAGLLGAVVALAVRRAVESTSRLLPKSDGVLQS
jgi:hypothetical protein